MVNRDNVTITTRSFSRATLEDGAKVKAIKLPHTIKPRAEIVSLVTGLEIIWSAPPRDFQITYYFKDNKVAPRWKAESAYRTLKDRRIRGTSLDCHLTHDDQSSFVRIREIKSELYTQHLTHLISEPDDAREVDYSPDDHARDLLCKAISARVGDRVETFEMSGSSDGRLRKALIRFQAFEAHNIAADAKALNEMDMSRLGCRKASFSEHICLHVTIDYAIYSRQSNFIKDIAHRALADRKIHVLVSDGDLQRQKAIVKVMIEGNNRKKLLSVKSEIDECIADDAGLPLHSHSKKHVRISSLQRTNESNGAEVGRLGKAGGDGALCVYHYDTEPPTIRFQTHALQDDENPGATLGAKPADKVKVGACAICAVDDVELLQIPGCGHKLCASCLEWYCAAGASSLRCPSMFGCQNLLPISWLVRQLSPYALQTLTQGLISMHCQMNPGQFVNCVGLDCSEYLAKDSQHTKETCTRCLTVNCTECKTQYHYGETCEESQARRNPVEDGFRRYLAEGGGNLCPLCKTPGVKVTGCDHIECPVCSAYYCWTCLGLLPYHNDPCMSSDE